MAAILRYLGKDALFTVVSFLFLAVAIPTLSTMFSLMQKQKYPIKCDIMRILSKQYNNIAKLILNTRIFMWIKISGKIKS